MKPPIVCRFMACNRAALRPFLMETLLPLTNPFVNVLNTLAELTNSGIITSNIN